MRIALIQLARLGDILQTLPAAQALKKVFPDSHITLIARARFSDAARISRHVDRLVELPTAAILEPGARAERLARLTEWVLGITEAGAPFDRLVNLTFSPASAALASLIPALEKRGMQVAADGTYVIPDPWSQYFFAQVLGQNLNALHLNDLFTRICGGAEDGAWPVETSDPAEGSGAPGGEGRERVGIQVAASQPEKTLDTRVWAAIGNTILAADSRRELVFFGSESDAPAIEAVVRAMQSGSDGSRDVAARCVNLAGRMRFHENLAWIKSCRCVVAPDTAITHLASIMSTRVVQVSIGPVRAEETGPYGDGHYVVYPVTRDPSDLAREIARLVAGEPPAKGRPGAAVCVTKLARCAHGGLRNELRPENFSPEEVSNFFTWAYYLLAEFRCAGREEDIEIPILGDPGQPGSPDRLIEAFNVLCQARRLAEFGQHYCLKMLQSVDDKIALSGLLGKVAEVERSLVTLKNSFSFARPLIDTWLVAKDLARAPDGVEEATALAEGAYRELGQNVEIIQHLLQTAVRAAQKRLGIEQDQNPKERDQ